MPPRPLYRPVAPVAVAAPPPTRPRAARVLLLIDLFLLVGAIALPLLEVAGGSDSRSIAQMGRPGLAPFGGDGVGVTIMWWLVVTFVILLVQALSTCLALARVLPGWVGTLLGVLGSLALAGSVLTVTFVLIMNSVDATISAGWAVPCLIVGQILYLVVMFAPSLVRGWRREPNSGDRLQG